MSLNKSMYSNDVSNFMQKHLLYVLIKTIKKNIKIKIIIKNINNIKQ